MEKKREELVERLRSRIAGDGAFPEGKLPPEREFAAELGVSRNLLREAMVTLEALGLLEIRERQGAYIRRPEPGGFAASLRYASLWPDDMLIDLMEMRLVIEVPIAGLAADRRDEGDLARMRECLRRLAGPPGAGTSSAEFARWDSALHKLVVDAARNPLLGRLYEGLASSMETQIQTSRERLLALDSWAGRIVGDHAALVDAIASGDAEAARQAQARHLGAALEKLRELAAGPR